MSIEAFLDLIRQRFSPSEGKIILKSWVQDPLVWQFVQNEEKSLPYFESAHNKLYAFAPGSIAEWLIEQEMDLSLPEVKDLSQKLPDAVRQRAAKTFQTIINTGLPPMDLLSAGLLALALRERRVIEKSWKGISDEILTSQKPAMTLKHYQAWRTPFSCLFTFCPDIDQAIADFIGSPRPHTLKTAIPLFLHAFLANPKPLESLLDELFAFAKSLPMEGQLTCLQWLASFEREGIRKTLARNLMQTRDCQLSFAKLFSEVETLESTHENGDPLEKPIRFSLPERLNQLAAFHYHSGDQEKAVETYQKSCDVINTIQSQTQFQALALQGNQASPSSWMKMIRKLPNSQKAHLFHIRSLIEKKNFDEARQQLENIPDSSEKNILEIALDQDNEAGLIGLDKTQKIIEVKPLEKSLPIIASYVRRPDINSPQELTSIIGKIKDPQLRLSIIRNLLDNGVKDTSLLTFARNEFEINGAYPQAIEVASFLERVEPEAIEHQRALARLYCKASRWEDAFSLLQKMVRDVSDPEMIDLAAFAESALMIGRIDMAISICQNILKQDKTNPKALILLGKGYMEKGDVVKAIQHMEQVVSLIPDEPQTWIQLARFWENSGQTDRAFTILRQGILAIPDNPDLLREIGIAHLEKASPTEARVYLRKAFESNPANNEVRLNLAKAEFQLGNYKESHTLIKPLTNSYETNMAVARLLGNLFFTMGEKEQAAPVLLSAAQQAPSDLDLVLKVSDLVLSFEDSTSHFLQGAYLEKLEVILNSAFEEFPDNLQLRLRLADVDRLRGRNQKAHDNYTMLAMENRGQKDFPDWRVQYGLGLTSSALGDIEIGLAALQDAALAQPDNLKILHALAKTYADADLQEKAFASARSAIEASPQEIANVIWYAKFNADNNRPEEALQALKEALQLDPERLDLQFLYAKTLIVMDKIEESIERLDELISNEDAVDSLLHQIAYLYIEVHELDRASIAFEKARDKCEQTQPLLLMDLAVLYTIMDQRKKALEILDLPDSVIQQYPHLAMLKSDLLSEIGQYPPALKMLDFINDKFENFPEGQDADFKRIHQSPLLSRYDFSSKGFKFRRGQLLRAIGHYQEAQSILEKLSKETPKNYKVMNAFVGTSIAKLDYQKAMQKAEQLNLLALDSGTLDLNQLDLVCNQIELLLDQAGEITVKTILNNSALDNRGYPRINALKSRVTALEGHKPQATDYLNQAIEDYHENLQAINPTTPSDLFRVQANLQSFVNAFREIGEYQSAHQYQQEAWKLLNNQPDINWRYVQLIIQSAENQQIAQIAKVTEHAPGPEFLDNKYYQLGEGLLEGLKPYLPEKDLMCLQSRLDSAFSGKWPSHLNVERCLETPEVAAAFILGCEDENRVNETVRAFPQALPVLQASAVFSLKTDLGDGINAVEKALEIDTANPILHALYGLMNFDNPEIAVKSFETAIRFWPGESEWHRILADLYTDLGDVETAANYITKAIEKQPDNGAYWQTRAGIHLKLNQLEMAKKDLKKSTQLQSQDAASWVSMADVNRRLGNTSEAIENMHTAVSLEPHDNEICVQEIELLLDQRRYQEAAEKALSKIGKNVDNKRMRILLARSRAKLGDFDDALEALKNSKELITGDPDVALEAIKIKGDQDGIEEALPKLVQLAEKNPEHPEILTTLTDWLIQTDRLQEAQATAQTILRIIPDSAEVHLMLGRLQRLKGQLDQAIAHLSDAITHNPELIESYIELGKAYQDRRNLEEAIKVFQMGSKVDASDPRPYYHAGMALKTCKDYSGAEEMLKQAKKYAPSDANIIRQLGVITALNLINNLRETR